MARKYRFPLLYSGILFEENGRHTLLTRAYDEANNVGISHSIALNVDNVKDNVAPTTSITTPTAASTVSDTITVVALASDNIGVCRVELYHNSVLVGLSIIVNIFQFF